MKADPENSAFASGLPHVAYVLLWYPLFTQPFIFREVESLRKIMPLEIYTLYGHNLRHCSEEMKHSKPPARVYGMRAIFSIFAEIGRQTVKNPARIWKLFRRTCFRRWPSLETFGENLWAFCVGIHLGRAFREDGVDFVYAPWPRGAATAAWIGADLAGLPFAISARGDNLAPADPDLEDKISHASFVRANNAADKKRIEDFGKSDAKNRTVLLYNSLTLPNDGGSRTLSRVPGKELRILALGRFDVTKGFDVLLKACALLKKKGLDFHLTLAGGGGKVMGLGDMDSTLRKLRHELDLENEVEMPGLVSHDELPRILASHDVFAAPCVVHSSGRRDGIPNTVIEAMAFGLPVVSTNVNALPEIVRNGETGLAVPPEDPGALADAISWIGEHPKEARLMGENGAKLAAEIFDPQRNAANMAEIFVKYHDEWRKGRAAATCVE